MFNDCARKCERFGRAVGPPQRHCWRGWRIAQRSIASAVYQALGTLLFRRPRERGFVFWGCLVERAG